MVTNINKFFSEVREELAKVTWPSRDDTVGTTIVVIVLVIIVSLFLGVIDIGLSHIMKFIVG